MDYESRLKRIRARLAQENLGGLYLSNLTNIRYLCGFTGSAGHLLISAAGARFLSDGRYRTQVAGEVRAADVEIYRMSDEMGPALGRGAKDLGIERLGFEAEHVPVAVLEQLRTWFEGSELVPTGGLVEQLRQVKEPAEVELMRIAAGFADQGFAYILERVEVGRSELQVALDLEFHMRKAGAEAVSFDLIVAAAERSALPHARPTGKEIEKGRFLLFDLGCKYEGYCSDLTRTIVVGPADDRHRETYDLVARAHRAGVEALGPGEQASEVDRAARSVIEAAGRGEAFGHGLGHGVGLEVHEAPYLRATSTDVLEAGNVVTIEPGVYFPEWGGVRIEDLAVVTSEGREVLSRAPQDLIVL